jgi:hypothetical protein
MPEKPDGAGPHPQARPGPGAADPPQLSSAVKAAVAAAHAEPPPGSQDGDVTSQDIEAEHVLALSTLTPEQARALVRLNRAFRESHLGNCSAKEALARVYEEEAAERNRSRGLPRPDAAPPGAEGFSDVEAGGGLRSGSVGSF